MSDQTEAPLSAARRKALEIIEAYAAEGGDAGRKGIGAHWFAMKMWPDSPGWSRVSNVGYGATRGVGMPRAGGSFLAVLEQAGLLHMIYRYHSAYYTLSPAGRTALTAAHASK